ncbi:UDP-N-acetylmuramoyl-tripeptide--D-alanyl-D-alanine ligase [Micromonospora sp. WMMD980]|uniref:UDP-N-acetylmuramoyl-tripeptide--D-alanyl-D- alanine ligase n=1 Tax=Micromonospora sp. WMMD980 TaxID=3016088 RepID=UPI002416C56C|nr:UDP-N-acetylmuramoyl-tripeptide--D-alanyl-D-alanine ligase [Micromonospora sp. WMMD980]MDG4798942.1 UDP-N-acetylmuramoyl-tripeptide--D-alanyl-D-alanine ligase [Micromonospora sp. WMMD980]MDG4805126.1 UDP-N-acetylmuramoyl-tripeptide--D-alanyl-D-alanine ligase [Micromonospora sp. WMMD980]MDG4805131.1 UDP-N-acetylmuramoyl-tripeptide--D-alanyl-D-alanine ligase [Micromonospora sp. WMMD980]
MTLQEITAAIGGAVHDAPDTVTVAAPVVFDSRRVEPGGMFVALPGKRVDGHDYAVQAIEAGAAAVLASRPVGVPAVVVEDVPAAYGRLARAVVDRLPQTTVIGVTGSVGKTSTKDILAQILPTWGATVANRASNNNELGLPYTVTRATADTRYLVLEMGARGIGHVAYLTRIAPPRVSVVTRVGHAHLGEFGSVENIAQAKGEIVEALPDILDGGLAVLNGDDALVAAMASRTTARVLTYGIDNPADVRAEDVTLDELGRAAFRLVHDGQAADVRLRLYGLHQASNALAAATVALGLGHPIEAVAEAVSQAEAVSPGRMQVSNRADGVTIINDAYNAAPDAMRAALRALKAMTEDGRRAVAVLGEMAELGEHAAQVHREIGQHVAEVGAGWLVAIGGADAGQYAAGAAGTGTTVDRAGTVAEAWELLRDGLRPGDVVLVKAANSAGLLVRQPPFEMLLVGVGRRGAATA